MGVALGHDGHALQRGLQAHLLALAAGSAQPHHGLHAANGGHDIRVDRLLISLGNPHEVHGLRLHWVTIGQRSGQVPVDELGEEGRHRGEQHRGFQQHAVESAEGRERLVGPQGAAHPRTVHADVHVGEVLEEGNETRHNSVQAVCLHFLPNKLDEAMCVGVHPLVHEVRALFDSVIIRDELHAGALVTAGLLHEETVGVVPRQEHVLHHVADAILFELERLCSDDWGVAHVHAHGISAVGLDDLLGVGVVLQALAHLLAIRGKHQAVDDQVLEGGPVEEVRGEHHERVEPASSLVKALRDELGRESLLKLLLALERVVLRRVGHRAALKPAVEHLVDPLEHSFAHLGGDLDVVDEMPVDVGDLPSGVSLKLGHAADANDLLKVRGHPQRDGRAPVPIARDTPVPRLREPVVKALLLDEGGHPVGLVVAVDQVLPLLLDLDEPAWHGLVDQRSVRAPAMRIVVDLSPIEHQAALLLEVLLDVLVCSLHVLALEVGHLLREAAIVVDGAYHARPVLLDDAMGQTDAVIVLAEGRCLVDDTGTSLGGNVAIGDNVPRLLLHLALEVVEQRLVRSPDKLRALNLLQELEVLVPVLLDRAADPAEAVLADDPLSPIVLLLHTKILQLGVHAERHVGGQGPGRRRPRKNVAVLLPDKLELHNDGGVGDLFVPLRDLEVGERRTTGGAVRHDAEGPVDEALVEEFLEDPPAALHERKIHGLVVVVEVHPAAKPLYNLPPLGRVPLDN
mmetsp:Transcript_50895/g.114448  ORF Transcript_50895/g.114448 Transcript_50895/m.114448 type:complete len:741 (+) Transcript_50895:1036-3258(+)